MRAPPRENPTDRPPARPAASHSTCARPRRGGPCLFSQDRRYTGGVARESCALPVRRSAARAAIHAATAVTRRVWRGGWRAGPSARATDGVERRANAPRTRPPLSRLPPPPKTPLPPLRHKTGHPPFIATAQAPPKNGHPIPCPTVKVL
ncbi:hypothetical protein I4F81_012629 [Pyropia yezoensis]|uniref:Uncharacterized protein n=1 Tax=Pyropia yezoensis TaxID=2788 RepID=A0ACC3CIY1_PYRYE|nr:hypothetical protein I4F81_012629 [Neopyropia yezoensis]